jgi:hypothetical protein
MFPLARIMKVLQSTSLLILLARVTLTETSDLAPFWNTQVELTNSVDCKSTTRYGYTYPEIILAGDGTPAEISTRVRDKVFDMYGSTIPFAAFAAVKEDHSAVLMTALGIGKDSAIVPTIQGNQIRISRSANPHPTEGDNYVITPDTYREWIVNVLIEKYALDGSGQVAFFLGSEDEIPEDSVDWADSPNYVGVFTIFAANPDFGDGDCQNCKDQAERRLRLGGTVYLTKALIHNLVALTGEEPVQYLTEKLHWRLANISGQQYGASDVGGLSVYVESGGCRVADDGKMEWTGWTRHSEVTSGKTGGISE